MVENNDDYKYIYCENCKRLLIGIKKNTTIATVVKIQCNCGHVNQLEKTTQPAMEETK